VAGGVSPLPDNFLWLFTSNLIAFNQGEIGAKKIKRQNFLIEVSAF